MSFNENVFRFMSIRSGVKSKKKEKLWVNCCKYENQETMTHKLLAKAKADNDLDEMKNICKDFKKKQEYIDSTSKLKINMDLVYEWIEDNCNLKINNQQFEDEVKQILGDTVSNIVKSRNFKNDWDNLSDTIITASIIKEETASYINLLIKILKIYHLLKLQATGMSQFDNQEIIDIFIKMKVILPDNVFPIPRTNKIYYKPQDKIEKEIDLKNILNEIEELQVAYNEISSIKTASIISEITKKKIEDAIPSVMQPDDPEDKEYSVIDNAIGKIDTNIDINTLTIPKDVTEHFSSKTKNVIKNLKVDIDKVNPKNSLSAIKAQMSSKITSLLSVTKKMKVLRLNGFTVEQDKLKKVFKNRSGSGNPDESAASGNLSS